MEVSAALTVSAASGSMFDVAFVDEAGCRRKERLSACWDKAFEKLPAVRPFPSMKDGVNWPGYWWSVTTGRHIGYESWWNGTWR